jgi:hypothetical protein
LSHIYAQQAREHNQKADDARAAVQRELALRDQLIRRLHAEGDWSYARIAKAVGLTPELVAKIIRPQRRGGRLNP